MLSFSTTKMLAYVNKVYVCLFVTKNMGMFTARDFPKPNLGLVIGPFPNRKISDFSQFSAKKGKKKKWMRIPILRLQKRALNKNYHAGSLPFNRKTTSYFIDNFNFTAHAVAQLPLCVPRSNATRKPVLHMCCLWSLRR